MANIELTEDDLITLQRSLNEGLEPPPELARKLFPSLYQSFDFKTLKDSRIPTIEYQGKRSEAAILNEAAFFGNSSPLQLERSFEGGKLNQTATQLSLFGAGEKEPEDDWQNLIVQGDNLQFLKTCFLNQDPIIKDKIKGKVKLVYIDPPFATKGDFGSKNGEDSYSDRVERAEFIEALRERLLFTRELLADDGSIYLHLDQRMAHPIKMILDEIFGRSNFLNEIIWKRTPFAGSSKARSKKFPVNHDIILIYTKTSNFFFQQQYEEYGEEYKARFKYKDETGYYRKTLLKTYSTETEKKLKESGRFIPPQKAGASPSYKQYLHESKGKQVEDIWSDLNLANPMATERTDYPTQKPEILLERIIRASSNPGDVVMDVFAGSGTTAAVAEKLGRRWIACDFGKHAIYTMQKRLAEIADSRKLEVKDKKKKVKYGRNPEPFCVVSVGAFDFSKIMNLRQNRDAYISFVLGIFGITERDDSLAARYRVSNVCALKDNNPVEVFPVWNDDYLHNVRVDEEYLRDIIVQSGGRLKGTYYLVAPENCVRVGDTKLKNENGDRVIFKILAFPYKVLEEVSRNFSIEEQPNTPENINKLTSSIGFYFNEEVSVQVHRTGKGLRINDFGTSILDSSGNRYQGLDGLAVLLVDKDYTEENGLTVDVVIYAQNVKDNEAFVKGITENTTVIAIDRHGNESPVTRLSKE